MILKNELEIMKKQLEESYEFNSKYHGWNPKPSLNLILEFGLSFNT
jgi:hypothetical protein